MANRLTCYLEQDPIVIGCRCGAQYCLYYVTTTDGNRELRFLRESGHANFCPFCGEDYRTEEHKRAIEIQEGGTFTCPVCHSPNEVEKGKSIKCSFCSWKSNPFQKD